MTLQELGWHPYFEAFFEPYKTQGFIPARVAIHYRDKYMLYGEGEEFQGQVSGKFEYNAKGLQEYPAVGDWVAVKPPVGGGMAIIHAILDRRSMFARKSAGTRTTQQIVAANADVVFLVSGLDDEINLRRMERYLTVAYESNAKPVILLNKIDLFPDYPEIVQEVEAIAPGVDIVPICAKTGEGIEKVSTYLTTGVTGALLGSSGVGKTTIVNDLLGESRYRTQEVREADSHGRHTTTHRELVLLPKGGLLIDTPGMREIQLWGDAESLNASFSDIAELGVDCKFRDCRHDAEPGCAVNAALEEGTLDAGRYESYQKLQKELAYLARRQDDSLKREETKKWKKIASDFKKVYKKRDKH
jgi:ribosome biogenesis GTPase